MQMLDRATLDAISAHSFTNDGWLRAQRATRCEQLLTIATLENTFLSLHIFAFTCFHPLPDAHAMRDSDMRAAWSMDRTRCTRFVEHCVAGNLRNIALHC
jgi:hypothetical protein